MATPTKQQPVFDPDAFRDSVATITEDGKRQWIYPKKPNGWFHNRRAIISIVLLIALFTGPFLRYNGSPVFLFNLFERKFIVWGVTFWPQDFHLFLLAIITFFVFIILFTVIFGRVWCGWACPQTIFMEMVFRKIEYLIEGDAHKQYKLNNQPWNGEKILKKGSKIAIFGMIAFLIGNLMMSYLIGTDELFKYITESPSAHWGKFIGVSVFSFLFFFVFTWFREQACIVVCPYGRLQGVLIGKETMQVMYDFKRGETRGKINKNETERTLGDCIDCKQCVHVCPTGIDIRNGSQLECVGCTACIDACDTVMDKVGFDRGLVRYASQTSVETGKPYKVPLRVYAYGVVFTILFSVLSFFILTRSDVETTLLRSPGMTFQTAANGDITNLYTLQVVNKTNGRKNLEFRLLSPQGSLKVINGNMNLNPRGLTNASMFIQLPRTSLTGLKTKVVVGVYEDGKELEQVKTNFLGPL